MIQAMILRICFYVLVWSNVSAFLPSNHNDHNHNAHGVALPLSNHIVPSCHNKKQPTIGRTTAVSSSSKNDREQETPSARATKKKKTATKKKSRKKKKKKDVGSSKNNDDSNTKLQSSKVKGSSSSGSSSSSNSGSKKEKKKKASSSKKKKKKTTKKAASDHQRLTERSDIPRLWNEGMAKANGSTTFKIASWNVNGLRALLRKEPDVLSELVQEHDLDVLCLQETKLQDIHLDDPKLGLRGCLLEEEGYDAHYSCSVAKKGYSGTAVFVKKEHGVPQSNVTTGMGVDRHDEEGRLISIDFPLFSLVNVYVPNSGQKLARLDYRTEEWDIDLLRFVLKKQQETQRPVMWCGDLNVAHASLDVWNDGAKHLKTQPGVTQRERDSFSNQSLGGGGSEEEPKQRHRFYDCFRTLHPAATGHYSYWSTRAKNRPDNKGLRLDYFVCDSSFFPPATDNNNKSSSDSNSRVLVRDCYMIPEQEGSDHCPVVLELEIKKTPK